MQTLNLQYHIKRLCIKALNQAGNNQDAAILLGISMRTLVRYRRSYVIKKVDGVYVDGNSWKML